MLKKLIEKVFKKRTSTQGDVEMTTTLEIPSETHQSKWGYHPCSYETYRKLKELYKWHWQTVYKFHAWHRWYRKDEKNRHGSEPKYCELFVENKSWLKQVTRNGEIGYKWYPKKLVDHGVCSLYQRARMPQAKPQTPFDEETLARIEKLHAEAKKWFA